MKRIYVYIIATVLCVGLVVGEHYFSLTMNDVVNIESFETQRYLDTADIESELNEFNDEIVDEEIVKANNVNLTIVNTQNDTKVLSYTYKITIPDISGAYRYTINDKEKYVVFNARGEATITINSNEKIIIYDIPSGTKYTIEQTGGDSSYTKKANNVVGTKATGTINKDTTVTYSNTVPVKEPNPSHNPNTADTYTLGFILFAIALVIFIAIRYIKIKRFE